VAAGTSCQASSGSETIARASSDSAWTSGGHPLDRRQRLVFEAEGEREVEQQLGVGRALDPVEQLRVDRGQQLAVEQPVPK
jgi:hypothetical protein